MTITGPPFYDENEWEPDGLTLKEMLNSWGWLQGTLLSPFHLSMIQRAMVEDKGRAWRAAMQAFVDEIQPVMSHTKKVFEKVHECHEAVKPTLPPKNGPRWNPHARKGKGGRRR